MSDLIWFAVPGGFSGRNRTGEPRLSVVIIPRLDDTSLAAEGMLEWPPPELVSATLVVDFSTAPEVPPTSIQVPRPHIKFQPGVWRGFFPPDIIIRSSPSRSTTSEIVVDRTSEHASKVNETFNTCARTQIDAASHAALSDVVQVQLQKDWSTSTATDLPPPPPSRNPGAPRPPVDFRTRIATLREHPAVLRALGLIIDLVLPPSTIPAALSEGVVRVGWPDVPGHLGIPPIVSPWSRYGPEFLPGSTIDVSSGMLTLIDDRIDPKDQDFRWEVVTVDVDGAVHRLRDAARGISSRKEAQPGGSMMLPALRTAGLMLIRRDRIDDFNTRRKNNDNRRNNSPTTAVLTADDLILGYRFDISEQGGDWFSLHSRLATYRVGEDLVIGSLDALEEGHTKAHAATGHENEDNKPAMMRADEVVARWSGWSLAVPQPTFTGEASNGRRSKLQVDFRRDFKVPANTLPKLRFAHKYRIRARIADLAGGGLDHVDPAADRCASDLVTYRRFEPVASPGVALPEGVDPKNLGPAESVATIVIRSDGGTVAEFAADNPRYSANPRRVLSPPRASLSIAEQHGKLDGQPLERTFEWLNHAMAREGTDGETLLPDPAAAGILAFPIHEPRGLVATIADRLWSDSWPDFKPKLLELREGKPGAASPVVWIHEADRGDVLVVRLAKAEQITIELSSFLPPGFIAHFAMSGVPGLIPTSPNLALAESGRHPMVTPTRPVTLVHAVRRPLQQPRGTLSASREKDTTFAVLTPSLPLCGIDAKSTGQLEITAMWQEPLDNELSPQIVASVQTFVINRSDVALKEPIRHEFGDTRHRVITYSATAVSRFRQFFDDGERPDAFVSTQESAAVVVIPSSARPRPPVVVSVQPSFPWTEEREDESTIVRRRLSGHLRVELEGPWFQTGDGELLAVIVSTDGRPPIEATPFLTQAGQDLMWQTSLPPRWPSPEMFSGTTSENDAPFLEELGDAIDIVTYKPWFHGDRWYADVAIPSVAASGYCPFVQLAVARCQPNSLLSFDAPEIDLRLSRVVKSDLVTLLPERTLTVIRSGRTVFVTLEGIEPSGPRRNRVDVILEHVRLPPDVPANTIEFTVFDSAVAEPIAWRAVPGQVRSGAIEEELAVDLPPDLGPFRVRVREVELVGTADELPGPHTATFREFSERTVFTDTVLVPSS